MKDNYKSSGNHQISKSLLHFITFYFLTLFPHAYIRPVHNLYSTKI
jgi:hypothetical protein